jgi:hypothetical protein
VNKPMNPDVSQLSHLEFVALHISRSGNDPCCILRQRHASFAGDPSCFPRILTHARRFRHGLEHHVLGIIPKHSAWDSHWTLEYIQK